MIFKREESLNQLNQFNGLTIEIQNDRYVFVFVLIGETVGLNFYVWSYLDERLLTYPIQKINDIQKRKKLVNLTYISDIYYTNHGRRFEFLFVGSENKIGEFRVAGNKFGLTVIIKRKMVDEI